MNLKSVIEKIMFERVNNHSPLSNMRNTSNLIAAFKSFPIIIPYKKIDRTRLIEIISEQNIIHDIFSASDPEATKNQLMKKFQMESDKIELIKLIYDSKLSEHTLNQVLDSTKTARNPKKSIENSNLPIETLEVPKETLETIDLEHPDYRISMSLIEVTPIKKELLGGTSISGNFFVEAVFLKKTKMIKKISFFFSNKNTFPINNSVKTMYLIENLGVGRYLRFSFSLKLTAGSIPDKLLFKDNSQIHNAYFKFFVQDNYPLAGKIESKIGNYELGGN